MAVTMTVEKIRGHYDSINCGWRFKHFGDESYRVRRDEDEDDEREDGKEIRKLPSFREA